ncbi:MAG: SufD family Fe-S cluster assembly protein [bacterium]|nr:SufD family Fe-S cluster assembly protein [bacterium]
MTKLINLNIENKEKLVFNKPGDYMVFFHNLSGNYYFDIQSENVRLNILGIFTGKGTNVYDLKTFQIHTSPSSTSNLFIKGVFYDSSKLKYNGLIRIEKNAQKSHAYQKNQNLMMSKNCFIQSKPYLEILANDVFCTHGSTTGRINKDQLLYLESRGIEKKDAEKMIANGFVNEIIDLVKQKFPDFVYQITE